MRVFNAYIDGFSLYKGALESRPQFKWLDLIKFCGDRRSDMVLGKVYYFTAPVKSRYPGDTAMHRQSAYLRVLRDQGVNVVLGKFRKDIDWLRAVAPEREKFLSPALPRHLGLTQLGLKRVFKVTSPEFPKAQVWKFGEKGSDVNLASYLMRDVFLNQVDSALVVSADSDLATPISMAVEFGANVKVVIPKSSDVPTSHELKAVSSFAEELHIGWLEEAKLPRSYITSKGGNIVRPESWA